MNYPHWIEKAAERLSRPPTSSFESRTIGVTRLTSPAWQTDLMLRNWDKLPKPEPTDLIPAMIGTAWHAYAEQYERNDALVERPFSAHFEVDGIDWIVRGIIDAYRPEEQVLVDKKTAKTWSFTFGNRSWEEQLNVYAYLLNLEGYRVNRLVSEVVYLDWTKSGARRSPNGYPPAQFLELEVPLWPEKDTQNFIFSRLRKLMDPELCTAEERWERDEHWAVMRTGRKTALKRAESEQAAAEWMKENGGTHIDHRTGNPVRCLDWCPVKEFCSYGKTL